MPNQPQGPFSDYLTQAFQPTAQQPSGLGGNTEMFVTAASKFLDGLKQTRAQKFQLQQMEEEKARRGYETAIQAISGRKDITEAHRQKLMAPLLQGLIGAAGSVKEKSKDTGNHLTDFFKGAFTNLAGGPLPKGQAFDPRYVADAFTGLEDPEGLVSTHLTRGEQEAARIASGMGENATQGALQGSSDFQNIIIQTRQATGNPEWMPSFISQLPKDDVERLQRQFKVGVLNEASDELKQQPTAAPQVATAPPPITAGVPVTGQTAPIPGMIGVNAPVPGVFPSPPKTERIPYTPPGMPEKNFADIVKASNDEIAAYNRKKAVRSFAGAPLFDREPVTLKQGVGTYIDPADPTQTPFAANTLTGGDGNPGIFNAQTGKQVLGARVATAAEINRPSAEQLTEARAALEGHKALVKNLFKSDPSKVEIFSRMLDQAAADRTDPAAKMQAVLTQVNAQAERDADDLRASRDRVSARDLAKIASQGDDLNVIRNNYNSNPSVAIANEADGHIGSVVDMYNNAIREANGGTPNYGNADLNLIRALAKWTDPKTGVRDAEYTTFAKAAGKYMKMMTDWESLAGMKGDILDPATRKLLQADLNSIRKSLDQNRKVYAEQAVRAASEFYGPESGERLRRVIGTAAPTTPAPPVPAQPAPQAAPKWQPTGGRVIFNKAPQGK